MKKQFPSYCKRVCSFTFTAFAFLIISFSLGAKNFVIINKIMYDTPLNEQIATGVAYSNGEYIELYNAGIDTVSLNGWVLRGGGSTEIYSFPAGTTMTPKSYLIVAYQYNNSGFTLDQLYSGLTATANHQIQYQRKIIWSNSGEPVYLRSNTGITKDSIYYDGTSSKTKPNRLSADNADGLDGNSCVSLQRKSVEFDVNGCAIPNNLDWVTAPVSVFQQNSAFVIPVLPGVIVSFTYDAAGNRISRKLVDLSINPSPSHVKQNADETTAPVEDQLGERKVTVYPNPTKGMLGVEISGGDPKEKLAIMVFSAQGVMLQSKKVEAGLTSIQMGGYAAGWYILRVTAGDKVTEFKIIKQ